MQQVEQDGSRAQAPITEATTRVEEIISQAEAAAGNILETAEFEAERYVREVCRESEREALEHAKALSELSNSLVAHAEILSRQSSLILEQLNELAGSRSSPVQGEASPDLRAAPLDPTPETRAPVSAPEPEAPQPIRQERSDPGFEVGDSSVADQSGDGRAMTGTEGVPVTERYSAGARLLATQMAVAGSDRTEIRERLVEDFEIHDPDPLLDMIMGRN